MHRRPIGKDNAKVSKVWVLYRDWLYGKIFLKKFLDGEVVWGRWRYRGPRSDRYVFFL